jgi:hypothetical protein
MPTGGIIQVMMLPLSRRTYGLMQRALDAVEDDDADLITTLVASAFVDGREDAKRDNPDGDVDGST